MTPHTGIAHEVAGGRTPGTIQLEALDHHTMEPGRSNIRHQDTTVTLPQDITKQASHSKAQAVGPQALFSCDQQTTTCLKEKMHTGI